uniref:Transposase n=1 Tax=Haemonchus contortus TaxID=6289 RepID=A0A7I5E807_HAECO
MAHDLTVCGTFFVKKKFQKVLSGEDLAPQHRPLLTDIANDLPEKSRTGTERRTRWWQLHQFEREQLKEKIQEAGLPHLDGAIQQTWSNAAKVILRCAKETLGETRAGFRGDKEAWL